MALMLVEERDIIAVQPMAPSHALALLKKKLRSLGEGDELTELAVALDYMPLAIVQAAAYISQRAPRYSVQRYLEDFRKSDRMKTSFLDYGGGPLRRDWDVGSQGALWYGGRVITLLLPYMEACAYRNLPPVKSSRTPFR